MTRIAIVGAGLIGRSWAVVFARAGMDVAAWDPEPATRSALEGEIAAMLREAGTPDADAIAARVTPATTMEAALDGADLVQESGPERIDLKRDLFARLDAAAAPETILASSSSALVPSLFSDGLAGAARCLVAHPVNPPHLVPVVELCPSPVTSSETMDRAEAIYRDAGQVPVRLSREIDGFVLNRLQAALLAEALRLVSEGVVSVEGLDDTVRHGLGRRWAFMGPMETIVLNAPGGAADYMLRYGPPMGKLAADAAGAEAFSAEAAALVAAAFPALADPPAIRARQAWRDGELAALDTHLRTRSTGD
ncbi:3-hydroxyacyl-CoA dehydrogenase [Jannaschia rubra]|uniref:3-hydroxyacyl-CoA dehydrogenase n=1 Tax=Jannaschia rubra TaxID=282197 RepID=UPI0024939E7A|nr:3-hydroxyacyl-CoA dehydrogenase [Jannaschia rubra]